MTHVYIYLSIEKDYIGIFHFTTVFIIFFLIYQFTPLLGGEVKKRAAQGKNIFYSDSGSQGVCIRESRRFSITII